MLNVFRNDEDLGLFKKLKEIVDLKSQELINFQILRLQSKLRVVETVEAFELKQGL